MSVSTMVFVSFANGSTAFRPTAASVETLLNSRDAAIVAACDFLGSYTMCRPNRSARR